jgi:HSP20 family protein
MRALRDALADLPGAAFADLLERDDAYLLVVDVPGATAESTEVTADGRRLRVAVERAADPPEGFEYVRRDRDATLTLDIPLPPDADAAGASATVERGVLELRLPRGAGGTEVTVE